MCECQTCQRSISCWMGLKHSHNSREEVEANSTELCWCCCNLICYSWVLFAVISWSYSNRSLIPQGVALWILNTGLSLERRQTAITLVFVNFDSFLGLLFLAKADDWSILKLLNLTVVKRLQSQDNYEGSASVQSSWLAFLLQHAPHQLEALPPPPPHLLLQTLACHQHQAQTASQQERQATPAETHPTPSLGLGFSAPMGQSPLCKSSASTSCLIHLFFASNPLLWQASLAAWAVSPQQIFEITFILYLT